MTGVQTCALPISHDYKTARDRRTLRSAANAGTIERLRMNADDLLTRAHAIELDTDTIADMAQDTSIHDFIKQNAR